MTTNSNPFDLCKFEYSNGTGCPLPAVASLNGYCRTHAKMTSRPAPAEQNEDLTCHVTPFASDPPTEDEIHSALAQIFRALVSNRISTRRAATFGYLAQLLLASKGSKQARQDSNNLSHMVVKILDLAYNPKYNNTINPAIQSLAGTPRPDPDTSPFSSKRPSPAPQPQQPTERPTTSSRRST
jgi:hypothetical protein